MAATVNGIDPQRVFRRVAAVAALVAASVIAVSPAAAQVRAGGHMLYKNEVLNGTFGYGGRAEIDLGFLVEYMMVSGSYERLWPECEAECDYWEAGGQVGVYSGVGHLGLGLSFSRFENTAPGGLPTIEDDWIFALIGGIRYPLKGLITPFFEIRNELGEGILNSQTLSLGILLGPYIDSPGPRASARRNR